MSIRLKLLLLALTTLVLPWAGCQYAREVQTVLRASQEQALLASAGTIANALSAQPQRMFHDGEATGRFDAAGGDIYAFPLRTTPLLDGYHDDWDIPVAPRPMPGSGLRARLLAGVTDRYLFLYVEVDDAHFDASGENAGDSRQNADRIEIALQDPDGAVQNHVFTTIAPGLVPARSEVRRDDGSTTLIPEPRIQGFWLQRARGYSLELRIPLSMVGARLWIEAVDGANDQHRAGTLAGASQMKGGRLFFSSGTLIDWLKPFIRNGTRATIIDANALKLASAGSAEAIPAPGEEPEKVGWYRRFQAMDVAQLPHRESLPDRLAGPYVTDALKGHPAAQWFRAGSQDEILLAAAAPVVVSGTTVGAVVLEQAGEQLLGLRDRALSRLFNLTLLATGVAVAFVLGFATWLSMRIGRLRDAADSAVRADGQIDTRMPEGDSGDELGELSRSFSRMLGRLSEHTAYLRTLGGKLSHELRTPMSIVRSSLDNLEQEGLSDAQRVYLVRAQGGAERLQGILSALGAAARVEESIRQAERIPFDLKALIQSAVAGYRDAFSGSLFDLDLPGDPCHWRGAPELVVQMLDKLVENAVDFTPAAGRIGISLRRYAGNFEIAVTNDGPVIPEELLPRLFESLFELRETPGERPHFGLGLYIVRLIAEFHGGKAIVANRADGGGVTFSVSLPMI
ncbi:MAG: HAMP domain-containing protein [Proteobacteria bacterium]|nr:HAMP domain-containing protein [Pseudomonadota bacterium]